MTNDGSFLLLGGTNNQFLRDCMKVLAFEDTYDIAVILESQGIDMGKIDFQQKWNSQSAVETIATFEPDVLLLDHFMPPYTGLEVLRELNFGIQSDDIARPRLIVAMSSDERKNELMLKEGADVGTSKFEVPYLSVFRDYSS
jgi:CheY-like chemotaxis protein